MHPAEHQDGWLSRDVHLLLTKQLLEEGDRPQGGEADGLGRSLPGIHTHQFISVHRSSDMNAFAGHACLS